MPSHTYGERICILTIARTTNRKNKIYRLFLIYTKRYTCKSFYYKSNNDAGGSLIRKLLYPFPRHALQHTRVRPEDLPDLTSIFHQIKLKPGRVIAHKDEGRRIKSSSTKLHDPPVTHRGGGDESN